MERGSIMHEVSVRCTTCGQHVFMDVPMTYAVGDDPEELPVTAELAAALAVDLGKCMEGWDCPDCHTKTLRVDPRDAN
jgi:hypothetical protein